MIDEAKLRVRSGILTIAIAMAQAVEIGKGDIASCIDRNVDNKFYSQLFVVAALAAHNESLCGC